MKFIWIIGCGLLLVGCAGDLPMASRSELDGDPIVTTRATQPPPSGAVESMGVPANPLPTPPPPVPAEVFSKPEPVQAPAPAPAATPEPTITTAEVTPPPAASLKPVKEQVAVIETTYGKIVIRVYDKMTPKTAENFKKLVQDGYYNETTFHRVVPGFVIQGGDPNTRSSGSPRSSHGAGGPGYTLPPEQSLPHIRGAVAMARLGNDVNPQRRSHGSQFYICLGQLASLDGEYTVFGQVIEGMEVVERITAVICDENDNPKERIEMTARLENRKASDPDAGH